MKLVKGGLLVTPNGLMEGDVLLDGARIGAIVTGGAAASGDCASASTGAVGEVFDASGCWVFPGFIDAHTHMQAFTGMDWTADSFETGTRAAACGGTTTIVDYATQDKGMTLAEALDEWHRRADGACTSNYAFHMSIADWNEQSRAEVPAMFDAGISSFKAYFAYDHLRLNDAEMLQVMEAIKPLGGVLCVHCENGTLVNELQSRMFADGVTGPEGHPLSRPAECEAEAIARLCYLAELSGARVNVVHLSSALGLEAVRDARKRGVQATVETCPQYLLLDDSRYGEPGFGGAKYVMSPPLRKPEDAAALRQAVLSGEVDTIATDHCAFNLKGQKDRGLDDFRKIPNGGPGVEHRPALVMTAFADELNPTDFCRLMSEGPAKLFGMYPQKGALQQGSDADVTVWDPTVSWTISAQNQHQNVDYTCYEGFPVCGRARFVFVNGHLVARDGEPTGDQPGTYVRRNGRCETC